MADKTLDVLTICGSLRKGSYNRMVMNALPGLAPPGMSFKEAPPYTAFPLFNADDMNAPVGIKVYQLTQTGLMAHGSLQGTKYWKDEELN